MPVFPWHASCADHVAIYRPQPCGRRAWVETATPPDTGTGAAHLVHTTRVCRDCPCSLIAANGPDVPLSTRYTQLGFVGIARVPLLCSMHSNTCRNDSLDEALTNTSQITEPRCDKSSRTPQSATEETLRNAKSEVNTARRHRRRKTCCPNAPTAQ